MHVTQRRRGCASPAFAMIATAVLLTACGLFPGEKWKAKQCEFLDAQEWHIAAQFRPSVKTELKAAMVAKFLMTPDQAEACIEKAE